MTKDEALKLALEALELEDMACRYEKDLTPEHIFKAITALREALANYNPTSDHCMMENAQGELERIRLVQTGVGIGKPQQEPVAYDKTEMNCFVQDLYDKKMKEGKHGHYETMFHVVHQAIKRFPPQRKPLTDEQIYSITGVEDRDEMMHRMARNIARAIEAAHGIKGEA